jgi:DNA-directed RNA polymerase subunit alpha
MRIRWRNLELPTKVVADSATRTDTYARFTAEPFERGYGVTIGNGLRRVLLSSIEGTAVTSVKVQGVRHEFSSMEGVREDLTDIVLALKRLRVRFHTDEPKVLRIEKKGPGPVTAADIQTDASCEIVNRDLVICTLTSPRTFDCEIEVRRGRGYVTAEENAREEQEIGVIPVDSVFSPIERVRYRTENTRVGKLTNYDRLILELWTDGTVTPEAALVEASKIYRKHLNPFIQLFDTGRDLLFDRAGDGAIGAGLSGLSGMLGGPAPSARAADAPERAEGDLASLRQEIELPIAALDLSVRASNCLEAEGIQTVGDLVSKTQDDLMAFKNFGRTSLKEITKKLDSMNLRLGMDVEAIRRGEE